MKTRSISPLIGGVVLALASQFSSAAPITIDFEGNANGSPVGATYTALGVTFDNAFFANSPYPSDNGSSTWVTGEADSAYNDVGSVAVTGHFASVTDFVSAWIVYADGNTTTTLSVYDAGANLLGSASILAGNGPLSIGVANIASFAFSWTGGGTTTVDGAAIDDVIGIDDFTFNGTTTVPEPATLALLGLGLAGLGISRRKKS